MRSDLEEAVLSRIKPSLSDTKDISKAADALQNILRSKSDGRFEPLLVGSVPKGTFLKDPDIDVFLLYPIEVPKETMAQDTLALGREILETPVEKYAEHPYIHGKYMGYDADIVPCYEIKDTDDMRSSVDRTPLHTEYIMKNLHDSKRDDVLLLKALLKGIGAYGAHAQVKGFSGYLCELMVLHYGDFQGVLKAASQWRYGEIIEMIPAQREFDEPLVVIDPVDPRRNVASAVDEETLSLFVYAAKTYLGSPKQSYFFPSDIKERSEEELLEILEKRGTHLVLLSFSRPDIIDENLYPQVEKACRKLHEHMEMNDFQVLHSGYNIDHNISLLFELEHGELADIKKHRGPPVFNPNAVRFRNKYGDDVYIEGHRLMTDRPREFITISSQIVNIIENVDMGSDINESMAKELKIVEGEDAVRHASDAVNIFFDKSFPWER